MTIFDQYTEAIRAGALRTYPDEAVWLITQAGCIEVANVASDPTSSFLVAKRDMAKARAAGLLAIVHSHPDYPECPSEADMRGQLSTAVPWGIVATDGDDTTPITWWGAGAPKYPLEDRPFIHGVTDCYSLIRDWYAENRGVDIIEVPRGWEWWDHGGDLYQQFFGQAGFKRIPHAEAEPGDVWLMQLRSPVPNHGGILLDQGRALHHPVTRQSGPVDYKSLSRIEPINRWLPHIAADRGGMILRYTGQS